MAKQFDASIKHLVEAHPADWLALAGLPVTGPMQIIDSDASSISPAADKVIRVDDPAKPYIAHLEFQASGNDQVDGRVLFYNVFYQWKQDLPVRSVVFLLRPEADRGVKGMVKQAFGPGEFLEFQYKIVRVWELPPEAFLTGGLGIVPLAPLSAVASRPLAEVEKVLEKVHARLKQESEPNEGRDAWAATMLLLGLRYTTDAADQLLEGLGIMAIDLTQSTTYQIIMEKGKLEGRKESVLEQGESRFGPPPSEIRSSIESITDLARIHQIAQRISTATDWHDLVK